MAHNEFIIVSCKHHLLINVQHSVQSKFITFLTHLNWTARVFRNHFRVYFPSQNHNFPSHRSNILVAQLKHLAAAVGSPDRIRPNIYSYVLLFTRARLTFSGTSRSQRVIPRWPLITAVIIPTFGWFHSNPGAAAVSWSSYLFYNSVQRPTTTTKRLMPCDK